MQQSLTSKTDDTGQYLDENGKPTGQYNQVIKQAYEDKQKAAYMAQQGLNPDGSPVKPGYNSQLDPATGMLKSQYNLQAPTIDYSKVDSYNMAKKAAMDTNNLSPWALLQKQLLDTEQNQSLQGLAGKSMQATAQARSGLAMRGGLSNAQRTSIALNGSRDLMAGNQGIYNQGAKNLLSLSSQDAQNKQTMLQQIMGLDTAASKENSENTAKASQFNITNALNEQQNQNSWNMDTYKEQMEKWAANKQAEATAKAGGGGGK